MKNKIVKAIQEAVKIIGGTQTVELTPSKGHGDFSTNIAMKLTKELSDNPKNIAQRLIDNINEKFIEKMEIAGPGFINIFVSSKVLTGIVENIIKKGESFGRGSQSKYINVEYISANPTGYLHIGHARGAALGATLSNILKFAGNKVDQEYYINDAGNQIDTLGVAVYTRYQQELGVKIDMPKETYQGNDIIDVAKLFIAEFGDQYKEKPYQEVEELFKAKAKEKLLKVIKKHLIKFGVEFDIYSSEQKIYDDNLIEPTLEQIKSHTFKLEGAIWLETASRGDDKDRVLVKKDGKYTYFAPDIAYHKVKLDRGYDELINIWGADHIGYIKRMVIALEYLGLENDKLDILTVQLVKLIRNGQEFKMSKRAGTSFTLIELINLVGVDSARFHMINRSNNSDFDFDINAFTKKTNDNPVFTIQYTHARASNVLSKSKKQIRAGKYENNETQLINSLNKFPELMGNIANNHRVHLLPKFLIDIAKQYNSIYTSTKIIGSKREESLLALTQAVKIILVTGLELIGVSHPEEM